jgi:hypothetical protein
MSCNGGVKDKVGRTGGQGDEVARIRRSRIRGQAGIIDNPVVEDRFFGWVCNAVPWYPAAGELASDVVVQADGQRPLLFLHQDGENDHPLIVDQKQGISIAKAQQIAEFLLHAS